jgi:hypothetical protein
MTIERKRIAAAILGALLALSPSPSHALFHISVIDEVLASIDGDETQQFVEIEMLFDAQNLVSNSVLAAFDEEGVYIEDILVVPADVPNGQNGDRWTMATAAFQEENDFAADFTMPAGIPLGGGMICWGAPGILPPPDPATWDHTNPTNYVDCLAYGTYSGPSNPHIGNPTTLVPEGHSLARVAETDDNANDFACADTAAPTNNAGESVAVPATTPCGGSRGSGIQVTPDEERILINKDVEAQRWAITRNLDDLTVTGNVYFPDGGDPLFLFCEQLDEVDGELELECLAADRCSETECPPFEFISEVTLPESFFEPPVDVAAIAARIGARIETALHERTGGAGGSGTAAPLGGGGRASGIQITPDGERVLISKDVGEERWAITRNLDDSTVTGNVFFAEGGDPLFLFCEQEDQVDDDLQLECFGADRCSDTACPEFEFIAEVTLPESFFLPPSGPVPTPTGSPGASPTPAPTPTDGPGPTDEPTPGPTPSSEPTPEPTPTDEPSPTPEPTAGAIVPTPTPYTYPYGRGSSRR